MIPKFDIFLACAPKDFLKVPYVVASISKYIQGYDNIFICSPVDIPFAIMSKIPVMVYTYLDENVLPVVSRDGWAFRPNWCFQQHLKLFQNVTKEWYLTIDCDIIINRMLPFFEEENSTQGGPPIKTSTSPNLSLSVDTILFLNLGMSTDLFGTQEVVLFFLKVVLASFQVSRPATTSNPICLKPSEKPPAPQ